MFNFYFQIHTIQSRFLCPVFENRSIKTESQKNYFHVKLKVTKVSSLHILFAEWSCPSLIVVSLISAIVVMEIVVNVTFRPLVDVWWCQLSISEIIADTISLLWQILFYHQCSALAWQQTVLSPCVYMFAGETVEPEHTMGVRGAVTAVRGHYPTQRSTPLSIVRIVTSYTHSDRNNYPRAAPYNPTVQCHRCLQSSPDIHRCHILQCSDTSHHSEF